jgi:DNA-binding transcriptional regulator GbsR (MarR family)
MTPIKTVFVCCPQLCGRTLNELCEHLDMTRQGVTQHLDLLEAANLVATVRRGREKLHFLNPVPLQEITERWIAKFHTTSGLLRPHFENWQSATSTFQRVAAGRRRHEKPRLKALSDLKHRLEKADD